MEGSSDIFIRSYYKDFSWLVHSLSSIRRYCSGFRRVMVVVPRASFERLERIEPECDSIVKCGDYRDDYLGQQVSKLYADTFTDADYICHIDSDCVFRRPTTPALLSSGGRLNQFFVPYSQLPRTIPWRVVTERFLGHEVAFEFMRRQPQTFPRWIYPALRRHVEAVHKTGLDDYVLSQPYRGFSEFNALGAYAYHYHRDRFNWFNLAEGDPPEPFCACYWSWGGIDPMIAREIEQTISGGAAAAHAGRG